MASIIFEAQSALRFDVDTNVDVSEASSALLKYSKPDGTTGSFTCTIDPDNEGIIYYEVKDKTELVPNGTWIMWSYVIFSDGRSAQGVPVRVKVFAEGELI